MFRLSSKAASTGSSAASSPGTIAAGSNPNPPAPQSPSQQPGAVFPTTRSRLPVPRSAKKGEKRAFSPSNLPPLAASPSAWRLAQESMKENEVAAELGSPAKVFRVDSVAENLKARLSYGPSPTKQCTHSQASQDSSSATHSSADLSVSGGSGYDTGASKAASGFANAYGIHPNLFNSVLKAPRRLSLTGSSSERIKVCVRKRPLSDRELSQGAGDILEVNGVGHAVTVLEQKVKLDGINRYTERHEFRFDRVFDVGADNVTIYHSAVQDLVDIVIGGGKATCFAYGQTGSGKTHTMLNPQDGLYFLAASELFSKAKTTLPGLQITVAFFEIYQNSLFDLLNGKRKVMACEAGDGQVHIVGLKEVTVKGVGDLQTVMEEALNSRSTGSTAANSTSSRSHAILQFIIRPPSPAHEGATKKQQQQPPQIHGKFSFIDLAGSERGSDRAAVDRQTKLEGAEINKSLLALKECIRAIDQDSAHLPFRQSKLTLVLKDSFIGNAKTCMIATVSPTTSNCEHTVNTLRYADRVKELKGSSSIEAPNEYMLDDRLSATSTPPRTRTMSFDASPVSKKEPHRSLAFSTPPPAPVSQPNIDSAISRTPPINSSLHSSPIKTSTPLRLSVLHASDFLNPFSEEVVAERRESCQNTLAILYDRLTACQDADLLDILNDELGNLLSALPIK